MSFFKKHPVLTLVILLAIIAVLIVVTVGRNEATPVESAVGNVVTPPSSGFNRITRNVGNWFRVVFGVSDLQKQNVELQERNTQLETQLIALRELENENERLKELANYVETHEQYDLIAARVAGKSPGYWFSTFTIDKGRNDGLMAGHVVINAQGALIGKISEVGGNWSKVEAIIDPSSRISAIVERTRDLVMVRGVASVGSDDSDRLCQVYLVPLDNDLLPGDVIVTSGLESDEGVTYPKGLPIGEVISVDLSSNNVERTAALQPQVSFSNMEEVLVIRNSVSEVGE